MSVLPPDAPERFHHPSPPSRYYSQDLFLYAPPLPLHGVQVPLIGEIWSEPPWILRRVEGIGSTAIEPQMMKLPFQMGETLLNTDPQPRVVTMTIRIWAEPVVDETGEEFTARQNLLFLRNLLAQALVVPPLERPRPGDRPRMGRLLYFREGWPRVELEVIPRDSPQFSDIPGIDNACDADLEFVAPDPYWRDVEFSSHRLDPDPDQLQFPFEFPFEFEAFGARRTVRNVGDVPAPVIIRFFGPVQAGGFARLRNATTGHYLEVAGPIGADEYVEVSTAFGDKRVERVDPDTGERENVLHRLDLAGSHFWLLVRGDNEIVFEAAGYSPGARAVILWKNRYAGV